MNCDCVLPGGYKCNNLALEGKNYCSEHEPSLMSTVARGTGFELRVLRLLELQGYQVTHNTAVSSNQTDLFAVLHAGALQHRVMVECKNLGEGKQVGIEELNKLSGTYLAARNRGVVDRALVVTTNGFTKDARAHANDAGIDLLTIQELANSIVDVKSYLESAKTKFLNHKASKHYVAGAGTLEEDFRLIDPAEYERPVEVLIDKIFASGKSNAIALLGNFGMGKSTLCLKLLHDYASQEIAEPGGRIPVLLPLRVFQTQVNLQHAIASHLTFEYGVNITLNQSRELQQTGRMTILLDGLDEMVSRVSPDIVAQNVEEIKALALIPNNRVILTCRTHFFRDSGQTGLLKGFELIYLPDWGTAEIVEYFKSVFGGEASACLMTIAGTHNLPELAQTPLFLEMIAETLPLLGDRVSRLELYELYTTSWLKDQSLRSTAKLDLSQRHALMLAAAERLFYGTGSCHHSELRKLVLDYVADDSIASLDQLQNDLQTCTFLVRDSAGNYLFQHPSFMEFFISELLFNELELNQPKLIAAADLSLELRGFLAERVTREKSNSTKWKSIKKTLRTWLSSAEPLIRTNAAALITGVVASRVVTLDELGVSLSEMDVETALFLSGDLDAFWSVISRYESLIKIELNRANLSPGRANELFVDVVLRASANRSRLMRLDDVPGYFRGLARNVVLDAQRRERNDPFSNLSLSEIEVIDSSSTDWLTNFAQASSIQDLLAKLPAKERDVIILSVIEGHGISTLSTLLGAPEDTIRSIRARGLRMLRRLYAESLQED